MVYANVQSSGLIAITSGGSLSWTPSAPSVNNLLSCRAWHSGTRTYGATDTIDSSGGGGKKFTMDIEAKDAGNRDTAIYTLVVPSGLTTPLLQQTAFTGGSNQCCFDEWSGNATTSVLDQSNSNTSATTNTSSGSSGTINTGANAGLVLAILNMSGVGSAAGISTTGTNFVNDAVAQNNSVNDSGGADHRITSAASQTGLQDTWSWTAGASSNQYQAVIASYNVPGAAANPFLPNDQALNDGAMLR